MKIKYLFVLLVIGVYWIGLIPDIKGGNDLPYSSVEYLKNLLIPPSAWSSLNGPFGQNQLSTLWSWPSSFLYGLGASLGLSFGVLVTLIGILPILIFGFIGAYKYSALFIKSEMARNFSAFFYLVNSYILLVVDGGQLLWGLAYAIFPYCLYRLEKQIAEKKYKHHFNDFIGVVALSFCDLRAVYLLGIWISIRLIYQMFYLQKSELGLLLNYFVKLGVYIVTILLLLHSYWLIPLFLSSSQVVPGNLVISTTADLMQFLSLGHAIFLQQPHWHKNIFGQVSLLNPLFSLIPVIVFFALILKPKKSSTGFLLVSALVAVFLAKGTGLPFGKIYVLLFEYIPGFFLFRDSSKFLTLVIVSYSILFGLTIEYILGLKKSFKIFKLSGVLTFLIIGYLLLLYSPAFTNKMGGLLGLPPQLEQFKKMEKNIATFPEGKVLWVSSKPVLAFSDPKHMALNSVDLISLRPFAIGTKGTYETLNFLREASYSGELLKVAGVQYLGYAPLNQFQNYNTDQIVYHQTFFEQLKNREWVKSVKIAAGIPILELEEAEKLFFIPESSYLILGSDDIYGLSTKSADLSLAKKGLVFLDEKPELIERIPLAIQRFVLYKKTDLDLMISLTNHQKLVFPAKYLTDSPNETGWWSRKTKDMLSFKDFLIQKYHVQNQDFDLGGGVAIGEGSQQLKVPFRANKGDYLFIRALESTRSGVLEIFNDTKKINDIDLQISGDNMKWQQIGQLSEQIDQITLKTNGDMTVINALVALPVNQYKTSLQNIDHLYKEGKIVDFISDRQNKQQPKIDFKKLSNDQYQLKVTGLEQPSIIVFSQSYDPKWQLNGMSSIPVYSIFNGFVVEKDGEYLVEYLPSKYLKLGGFVSIGSLLILVGSVVYIYYGKKIKKLV